jgi:Skp family chaperone for outer membrane proteins
MRDLFRVGGVLLLLGTLFLAGRSWSDTRPAAPQPRTRIAVVNLTQVIKSYKKTDVLNKEMKEAAKAHQEKDANINSETEKLTREAQDATTTAERREDIERRMKDLKRQSEDNKAEAQKVLGKKQEQQISTLYSDIHKVVEKYAQDHGLDMVLHYNDATIATEYWSGANIMRKIQNGALTPLYTAPGMDISKEIIAVLNEKMLREKQG